MKNRRNSFQFLIISIILNVCKTAELPSLTVSILHSGFHRELYYSLTLPDTLAKYPECEIVLVQSLHPGIYVSNDQLADMKRLNLLKSYVPVYVDVEASSEASSSLTLYLYITPARNTFVRLPIHLRYHAPSPRSFVNIPMYEPTTYVSCSDGPYERKSTQNFLFPCSNSSDIMNYEDLFTASVCTWFDIKTKVNSRGITSIAVPIGNPAISIVVVVTTIAVVWCACGYLLFAIVRKTKYLNKKIM